MNFNAHHLLTRFADVGLALQVASQPLGGSRSDDIVQLDISRGRQRHDERFRLWPGRTSTNRVEVEGTDAALAQLVLMIDEPRRRFEATMDRDTAESAGDRILRVVGRTAVVERFTEGAKRHFLCGLDEQHCFIAQLPEAVSTVAKAHQALRPKGLGDAERRGRKKALRQGEFFFVPVEREEMKRLVQLSRNIAPVRSQGIAQAARWSRAGRPHVADEVWVIRAIAGGKPEVVVLVRGQIRHPDHRTVGFRDWMRVFQNREPAQAPGLLWVD